MKDKLKQSIILQMLWNALKGLRRGYYLAKEQKMLSRQIVSTQPEVHNVEKEYTFIDRRHNHKKLCLILCGYKESLWDAVFTRIKNYAPEDVDICAVISGKAVPYIDELCERNGWSYLSTRRNQLCLAQNLAISLHPEAEWIYKVDEDMFLTKGFFEKMMETFNECENSSAYEPGFVAPLINVSCYGYIRILEKLHLIDDFTNRFFNPKYTDGLHHHKEVLENSEISKYMWGSENKVLADIDAMTQEFSKGGLSYSVCPMRFSIGALLFKRSAWNEFAGFPVDGGNGLGADEERICYYTFFTGRAIIINENVVVGHMGYGPQTKDMIEYYLDHKAQFEYKDI